MQFIISKYISIAKLYSENDYVLQQCCRISAVFDMKSILVNLYAVINYTVIENLMAIYKYIKYKHIKV